MRITCLITVCAYLSSTVSTEEKLPLHRIKKARSREELVLKDIIAKREIDPTRIYPEVYSALGKSRSKVQIEPYQRPEKSRGFQFEPQQRHQYNRDHSKHLPKRLKPRSIAGASYELSDNHLNEHGKPALKQDDESIHIEPVYRVTTKKNVFESIADILSQLLHPHKDELGPLVGPIKMPGRNIYLRLLEPIDASHVMVRFVTQVPVPVVDAEQKRGPIFSIPPVVDPSLLLMHGIHPSLPRPLFAQSSNHHYSVYKPRYTNHTKGRAPFLNKPPPLLKDPPKDINGEDSLSGADTKLKNHVHPPDSFPGLPGSYYQYQTSEEAVKQVMELINDTKLEEDVSKEPSSSSYASDSSYELSTHRLPLRQIAPLYPLTSVEHADSSSQENTYSVPNDVLTGPSSYSSSFAQFNSANSAPGYSEDSYNLHSTPSSYSTSYGKLNDIHSTPSSYSTSYKHPIDVHSTPSSYSTSYKRPIDVHSTPSSYSTSYKHPIDVYSTPSSYSTSYKYPIEVHSTPSSYSTSYQHSIDVHSTPSSYSTSYQHSNEFNPGLGLGAYATSYHRQNEFSSSASAPSTIYGKPSDLSSAPSSFAISYGKTTDDDRLAPSSNDALRVIDPPSYFFSHRKPLGSFVNQSFGHSTIRYPRYNLKNYNEVNSNTRRERERERKREREREIENNSQTILSWDESKRDKSESGASMSSELSAADSGSEKWQPLVYENAWHEAYADLTKAAKNQFDRPKKMPRNTNNSSSIDSSDTSDRRQKSRRRGATPVIQSLGCLNFSTEDECAETKSTPGVPHTEKPTQPDASTKSTVVTTTTGAPSSTAVETDEESNSAVAEKLTMVSSTMSSTTNKSRLQLIITTPSSTVDILTVKPLSSGITDSPVTSSSTTERSIVTETVTKSIASKATVKLPSAATAKSATAKSATARSATARSATVRSATTTTMTTTTMTSSSSEQSTVRNTTKAMSASSDITRKSPSGPKMPKRPMVMKKPTFIIKALNMSSIATTANISTTTQKPNSTTRRSTTTRKRTFRARTSNRKSSTT